MLFRNLRVHQVYGANTEVGKTVFTTALCKAASSVLGEHAHYLKPVGTGGHGDDWHVSTFAPETNTACLHYFDEPVSPHLAAERTRSRDQSYQPPSDDGISKGIKRFAESISKGMLPRELASLLVETAGGPHSPTLSGASQVDAYRSLRLSTVLVASPHLGGISTTISAYESLLLRGYDIDALLCFKEAYYENWKYFAKWAEERGIAFAAAGKPPEQLSSRDEDIASMKRYYESLIDDSAAAHQQQDWSLTSIVKDLRLKHIERMHNLDTTANRTRKAAWWPFVQHLHVKKDSDVMVIDSAYGDTFSVWKQEEAEQNGQATIGNCVNANEARLDASEDSALPPGPPSGGLVDTFDGSASWWTQCLGHANPALTLAAAQAAGRYGHVIFPTASHAPALELSEKLLKSVGKGWADRVFFSDNGSTGMEVALKMALRYTVKKLEEADAIPSAAQGTKRIEYGVLGLNGSYHGDTIGAMDACEGGVYSRSVEWYRGRGFWLDPPTVRLEHGKPVIRFEGSQWTNADEGADNAFGGPISYADLHQVYDVETRLLRDPLAQHYREHIARWVAYAQSELGLTLGALVLEPVVMGAGGQLFVDPLFQRVLVDFAREPHFSLSSSSGSEQKYALPVIYDEVYIGLYRLGRLSGAHFLGARPDIACYAKILTGGLLPLSVTLASEKVYDVFLGEQKQEALLHGHSYTAHPIGCAVANRTLEIIQRHDEQDQTWLAAKSDWTQSSDVQATTCGDKAHVFSLWEPKFVKEVSGLEGVDGAIAMGTVLVIYLRDAQNAGYQSNASVDLLKRLKYPTDQDSLPIHARPLGNTVYFISSLTTPAETLRKVESSIWNALHG